MCAYGRSCSQAATSASQLWQFLVRQDHLRDIFVYYVFPPEVWFIVIIPCSKLIVCTSYYVQKSAIDLLVKGRQTPTQAKVIHQEMDTVNCFCLNRVCGIHNGFSLSPCCRVLALCISDQSELSGSSNPQGDYRGGCEHDVGI